MPQRTTVKDTAEDFEGRHAPDQRESEHTAFSVSFVEVDPGGVPTASAFRATIVTLVQILAFGGSNPRDDPYRAVFASDSPIAT